MNDEKVPVVYRKKPHASTAVTRIKSNHQSVKP